MKLRGLILFGMTISLATLQTGCGNSSKRINYDDIEYSIIDDNYRNMYQIFPVSFADSDGNGKGDLKGIIDKLDYIQSMNYTGIWLNPIHPSSTYHHYDVEDYYKISTDFGTLTTFDKLVEELHKRNMTIILDLVINHSSNKNEWFTTSYAANKYNKTNITEYDWYNWIACSGSAPAGYSKVNSSDSIAYEARFDSSMPDFNLEPVITDPDNSPLAQEFINIFKFWLVDHDVDGFRLDAVTSYFTGDQNKNLQMLTFINNECKKLKENCYIVGEGSWSSASAENKAYQASGIDSFFQFGNSAKNTGYPVQVVVQQNAQQLYRGLTINKENADGGIEAPFLSNHDVPRYVGSVSGRTNLSNAKFVMGILQQMGGATFTYYGDEVGMASQSTTADGFYRLPLRWDTEGNYTCKIAKMKIYGVPSDASVDESLSYPYPTVEEQLQDENSLLNYVKKANLLRLQFPEIARGDVELVSDGTDKAFVAIKRTYNDSSITVLVNASYSQAKEVDYSVYGEKVVAELCAEGHVSVINAKQSLISLPPQSIVIVR